MNTVKSVVKSLYSRAAKVSSNPHNRTSEVEFVTKVLKSNGYPKEFLRKQRRQVLNKIDNIIETADNIEGSDNENKRVVTLPYIQNTTEKLKQISHRYNFMVGVKPAQKPGQVLTRVKDKVPMDKQIGIVYSIPCSDCNIQYIGKQAVHYRQENKNINEVLNNRVEQSALAEHVKQTGHNISWDDMRPLVKENRWCQRKWSEACVILKTEDIIVNRDCGRTIEQYQIVTLH